MSAENISTRRIETALRELVADDEVKIAVVAARNLPSGTKLADFIAEIWAWLKQFNMGRRVVSATRVDAALAQEPAAAPLAPAVRKRVVAALERTAREPVVNQRALVDHLVEANSAPNMTAVPKDFPRPWLKSGTMPRANGMKTNRPVIESIRDSGAWPKNMRKAAWQQFALRWFGTYSPSARQAKAFLAWIDEPTAKNGGGIKADKPTPAAAKPAKRKYTRRTAVTAAPEAPFVPRGDGFKELEITYGRKVEHDARYSGAKVQSPCFSVSSRLFPLSKEKASRIRLFWNADARTCAAIVGDTAGLKMQRAHGTQRAISSQLPALFGKTEIYFKAVKAPKDYDLMFEAVTHET